MNLLCKLGIHIWKKIPDKYLLGRRKCRFCPKIQTAYSIIGKYDRRGNNKICGWEDEDEVTCPNCHSSNTKLRNNKKRMCCDCSFIYGDKK